MKELLDRYGRVAEILIALATFVFMVATCT